MKNHPRLLLWIIVALFLGALFIVAPKLPQTLSLKIPIINKTVVLQNGQFPFKEGLDLQGGTSVTLHADMTHVPVAERNSALEGARIVLEKRVNLYGVSEPVIQTSVVSNDYRITVDLPGVNVNQAVQLIGTTAQLSFWEQGQASGSAQDLPLGIPQILGPNAQQTNLSGSDLQSATVTFDTNTGAPQVQLNFTNVGTGKFADITKRNVGKVVAIVLDNQVIEAPRVNEPILTGNAVITGGFTKDSAKSLSIELQAGALPVPLSILQQQSIGATLGQNALQKSLFAGILGFVIVVIFMTILYGRLGIIASGALVLYTLLVLGIFKLIPVTLTLAGIAGFILSIGMAVDANILIFERMKEELRSGKSPEIAMELGFSRAWSSIRDSNISTLITSGVLYKFGTGIVRGFALTLAIGVLVSMFSAIVVTRTLIRIFYKH